MAHVCQVSSASPFLLLLHAVITVAFLQMWHRLLPNLSQICTFHQKSIAKNYRIGEVWEGIKGIYKENNFKLNPSILKYSFGLSPEHFSGPFTSKDLLSQLFSCPLIGFCLSAFSSVFSSPCLRQACSTFCLVVASPADTHALRVLHSIPSVLPKFFPKERPILSLKSKGIIIKAIAFSTLLWWDVYVLLR